MRQERNKIKRGVWRRLLAVVLTVAMLPIASLAVAKAATTATETVSIQVTYGQAQARALLGQINGLRAKKNVEAVASGAAITTQLMPLDYDYGLEQVAMQRAAEVALVYDAAYRPNGEHVAGCYNSIIKTGTVVECISCMGSTAAQVYNAWLASPASTEYANMVEAAHRAVGVGHVSYNGKDYWVAAYADSLSGTGMLPEDNGTVTRTIEIESSRITSRTISGAPTNTVTINVGDSYNLSKCKASIQVNGHYPMSDYCPLVGDTSVMVADPAVATYNGSSLYGNAVGSTSVNITCGGLAASPFTLVVQQPSISQATIDVIADQSYTGYEIRPGVKVRVGNTVLTENIDYTLKYENNTNIGTALVTVTGCGKYANTGSKSTYFRIVAPTVANATITAIPDQSYTGYAICPVVTAYVNNVMLREGIDYTVSYTNNINIGTASVTLRGTGSYSGTRTTTFRITGPNLYAATIAAIPDQLYTGSDIRPTVSVTVNNIALRENIDYYVSYSNNRNIGTASVTVTGRGNYTGTRSTTFRIIGRDLSNATVSSVATQRYSGDPICPSVTVKIGSVTLQRNVDYILTYLDNVQPGTASIFISGTGSYSGSRTVTFKIAQASLSSAVISVSDQTYNGVAKTPRVLVKLNSDTLTEDVDYEVEYRNNKTPGKATVVISGIGDYSGSKKAYFVIKPKKMTWVSAKATSNSRGKAAALSWKGDKYASGYELYYSKKKTSGFSKIGTLKKNTYTKCTHDKRSRGTHYYKVRSYVVVDGKKYYSAFSAVKGVKIK